MFKKIFLLNIIIFLLLILLLELSARLFHFADLTGVSKNLLIFKGERHENAPNIEATVFSKRAYTDKFGFRIPYKNYIYENLNSSVLILGDSVSFGVGVEEEKTFVGLLRKEFKNINFYNSSVSGYHLKNYPNILKKNLNLENLGEVILFYTLNDISFENRVLNFQDQLDEDFDTDEINFFNKLRKNKYLARVNFFLRNKSVFYMWVKGVITRPSERHFYYTFPIYKNDSAIDDLKFEINKLKNITEKNNLELFIIILPYEFQTRSENCKSYYLQPQTKVKNILLSSKIKFKDYTNIFCNYEKTDSLFLKYDPVHLSSKGHELVFSLLKNDVNYLSKY